jgi:hypothetical protein
MPNRRIKATDLSEHVRARLCTAEEIWLIDPNHGMRQEEKHPWMELIVSVPPPVPDVVDPAAPAADPVVFEIEVDSTDSNGLVRIREEIKRICGEPKIATSP